VLAIARRPVAFRADHAGITLGSDRQLLPRRPAVFIPWADAERIILYPGYISNGPKPSTSESSAGREPRPWPTATEQVPCCPVPGVGHGSTRGRWSGRG
jgi:hypothetical protein